jgi:hypothetical protein
MKLVRTIPKLGASPNCYFLVPLLWRGRNNGNGASDIALADVKAVNSSRAGGDDASLIEKIGIGGRELKADGATIFDHACRLGFEGIVSKHRGHPYRSGPSKSWLKIKNSTAPGMLRFRVDEP